MLISERREITKEMYDRAIMENGGYLSESDKEQVFTAAELYGYGVYSPSVIQFGGKYYVDYRIGDCCD